MSVSSTTYYGVLGLVLVACSTPQSSRRAPGSASSPVLSPAVVEVSVRANAPELTAPLEKALPEVNDTGSKEPLLPFPSDLPLHTPKDIPISGDRNLRVAHAPEGALGAVIYLHGMCGNPEGADPWIDIATEHATVITVRANIKCPDRPGYKWPHEPEAIQPRIDAALRKVQELRNGYLNIDEVTLIGYSQGSHRGEKLIAAFPEKYGGIVLGGPPTSPEPELLQGARAVAILGGELEDTTHMEEGFVHLKEAGIRSKFFLLPHAHHGSYGPQGRRVMSEVLSWLWETPH